MLTFTDLLALMLTFFVLIFAMSQVKHDAWRALVDALSERLNVAENWRDPWLPNDEAVPRVFVAKAVDLDYLDRVLTEKIAKHPVLAQAIVQRLDDRLVLSMPAELLYATGSAELGEDAREAVRDLTDAFKYVANRIEIVGHSDPSPLPANRLYPSNWELSLARALAFANALSGSGYSRPLSVYGVADAKFYDLDKGLAEDVRLRLARRVDLIVRDDRVDEL